MYQHPDLMQHHVCIVSIIVVRVKTGGMCLDARADFWGKKLVFSQTNSHLLSGRGEGAKRRHVSNYRSTLLPPGCSLNAGRFCKTNQKKTKCIKDMRKRTKRENENNLDLPDWTLDSLPEFRVFALRFLRSCPT